MKTRVRKLVPAFISKIFGYCPQCNSDAPEIDNCKVCNNDRESPFPKYKREKYWRKYLEYKHPTIPESPREKLEREMFESEQQLGIPSSMRWHNSKPQSPTDKNNFSYDELVTWLSARDMYLYNYYTTYKAAGIELEPIDDFIKGNHEYLMDRKFKKQ